MAGFEFTVECAPGIMSWSESEELAKFDNPNYRFSCVKEPALDYVRRSGNYDWETADKAVTNLVSRVLGRDVKAMTCPGGMITVGPLYLMIDAALTDEEWMRVCEVVTVNAVLEVMPRHIPWE